VQCVLAVGIELLAVGVDEDLRKAVHAAKRRTQIVGKPSS